MDLPVCSFVCSLVIMREAIRREGTRARSSQTVSLAVATSLLAISAGCGRAASESAPRAAPALAMVAPSPGGGGNAPPAADRAMRITVETTVVVAHRDAAVSALRSAVAAFGGYVSEGTLSGADQGGSARFTVKVPASSVSDFRGKLASLGDVRSDSEKAEDVTEARADLRARLHNARAQEQRLLDLLQNHTGNLGDVVMVEKEIASVRETIERLEAEERTMEGQISFATVKVELDTVYVPVTTGPGHQLAVAAADGIDTAKSFVLGTVALALATGPTLLILAAMAYGVFFVLRAWVRQRRRARAAAST